MEKIKKYIIIVIAIIVFLIIIIMRTISKNHKIDDISQTDPDTGPQDAITEEVVKIEDWQMENSASHYYAIKTIIDNYYNNMAKFSPNYITFIRGVSDEQELKEATKEEKENVMNDMKEVLKSYIDIKKLSEEELISMFQKHSSEMLIIDKLYYKKQRETIETYYIEGTINGTKEKAYVIVVVDNSNDAYNILPTEYVEERYGKEPNVEQISIDEDILKVEKGTLNIIRYTVISEQDMCMYYFGNYMYNIKTDIKKVYDRLDEEYRQKRFANYSEFEDYINENYDRLTSMTLKEYKVSNIVDNNATVYICVDQYENYYIFKATAVMEYTLYLDNHTIDLPQFTQKYNSARNENKVAMNIEKIKDALNTQDYKYVYEKLDETFKENYYPTQASLEKFIKDNLFESNNLVYTNIEEKNGLYIFTVKINDKAGKSADIKTLNIVMQLNEGTDFTMSFSM